MASDSNWWSSVVGLSLVLAITGNSISHYFLRFVDRKIGQSSEWWHRRSKLRTDAYTARVEKLRQSRHHLHRALFRQLDLLVVAGILLLLSVAAGIFAIIVPLVGTVERIGMFAIGGVTAFGASSALVAAVDLRRAIHEADPDSGPEV